MNIEELREHCLSFKGVTESFPFDETTLVFKVLNKMYCLTDLEGELRVNVKCEPDRAIELREQFESVVPGYHMSKKHWNTVYIDGSIPDETIKGWIRESYALIVQSMPKKKRQELQNL